MSKQGRINFDTLKPEEFENILPELFSRGDGKVSHDPELKDFLARNPDCAALVNDLETIADTARSLFEPSGDPSDKVWSNIQTMIREESEHDNAVKDAEAMPNGATEVE